jgi:RNA polymerase sigma-70 factor (ECF subfamily)
MRLASDGSTSPTLLKGAANWEDHPAWVRFRGVYQPLLERWCRGYGMDQDSIDEVCQRIWIELADRMKTFEYDPSRTFRGWLRGLCQTRVLNFLRQRRRSSQLSLDDRSEEPARIASPHEKETDETEVDSQPLPLLGEGAKIQAAVKSRVKPSTWDAFWLVAVCDWSVARTAESLGMTRVAVYAARERVGRMLREQGQHALVDSTTVA